MVTQPDDDARVAAWGEALRSLADARAALNLPPDVLAEREAEDSNFATVRMADSIDPKRALAALEGGRFNELVKDVGALRDHLQAKITRNRQREEAERKVALAARQDDLENQWADLRARRGDAGEYGTLAREFRAIGKEKQAIEIE